MRSFPIFAVAFFVVPLIEIYLFIQVGGMVGVFNTVLLVILTSMLGAFLLRQQGLSTLMRFRKSVAQGRLPALAMLEGALVMLGGLLLLIPGFFTDFLGLLCLFPPSRYLLAGSLVKSLSVKMERSGAAGFQSGPAQSDIPNPSSSRSSAPATLEGEYVRKDERKD